MSLFDHLELNPKDEFNDIRLKLASDTTSLIIDVSAGVYRDEKGTSYKLPVVKDAEKLLHKNGIGYDYNFCLGSSDFLKLSAEIAVGKDILSKKVVSSCQTIGGTGACHLAASFLTQSCGFKEFYLGTPSWPNYVPLVKHAGGHLRTYRYYNSESKTIDFESMMEALNNAKENSIFILQLCCHNPTAADLSIDQWITIANIIKERKLIPFFDAAYQGFATGSREKDGYPIKIFIELGLEIIVCQSFSKSLGLYSERVGCLHIISNNQETSTYVSDQLRYIFRAECSSSPAYGSRITSLIANDIHLTNQWDQDLKFISSNLISLRVEVYSLLTETFCTPGTWDHILQQRGLFWYSGLTENQSMMLIEKYHIYLPKNGRINIAGLNKNNIQDFCKAFDAVVRNY